MVAHSPRVRVGSIGRWCTRAAGLVVLGVVGLLVVTLTLTAVGLPAARSVSDAVAVDLDVPAVEELAELEQRSAVVAPDGTPLSTFHAGINRHRASLDELPDHVSQAVLAAEDRRFREHGGYDPEAIARAALANVRAGTVVQGGSTITQQLAKAMVGDERTLQRKIVELRQALALEDAFTKDELLDQYLDHVYLGAGAYGVGAGAEEYFAVAADELEPGQSALLAGIIRSPTNLNPREAPEAALRRRNEVLATMAEEGWLTAEELAELRARPLDLAQGSSDDVVDPHLIEAVRRELTCDPTAEAGQRWPTCSSALARVGGATSTDRFTSLYTGGLTVTTTVEPNLQALANELIREQLPEPDGVTAALVAVDPRDGRVLAAASGRDFDDDELHLPLQGRRQPGSAFKPFVMAAALEGGVDPATRLEGRSGATFGEDVLDDDEAWRTTGVRNFGGRSHPDPTMHQAMEDSVNTAFADLILEVGPAETREVAERLGVAESAFTGSAGPEDNPSMALGGLPRGTTPLELATAVGAITQGGALVAPHLVGEVADAEGVVRHTAPTTPNQVLDTDTAQAVTGALLGVVERGTGTAAQLPGWDVAGKTGTTQEQRDVWFVGATPTLSVAVWIGHPTESVTLTGISSSGTAAPLWRDFVAEALADQEPQRFAGVSSQGPEPEPRVAEPAPDEDTGPDAAPAAVPAPASEPEPDPEPAAPPEDPGSADEQDDPEAESGGQGQAAEDADQAPDP